jgi:ABC-type antimicrobial peptide transport system permease subunit
LFAIALLVVAQRTKEIGIRKVVGAGITNLTFLLSKDFLKLVVVALVIAIPIAWLLTSKWLEGYAYRITLNPWYFIAAGLLALLIAFATISLRTIKAAKANPVKSLRTE